MECINGLPCSKNFVRWITASLVKWADILAEYALFAVMTYLHDHLQLRFERAAIIVCIWTGLGKIMTLGCALMVDHGRLGNYKMLLYSSVAYTIGLAFLYMSTPPVLSNFSSNYCVEYIPECFGSAQKAMFYISLVLIATGMAGHAVSLDPFRDQGTYVDDDDDDEITDAIKERTPGCNIETKCFKINLQDIGDFLVRTVVFIINNYVHPVETNWANRFGVPAITTFVATVLFFVGSRLYKTDDKPIEREDSINFHKFFHKTFPVWSSFVMCGLVSSTGNSFFVAQAGNLDKLQKTVISITVLLYISDGVQSILKFCYSYIMKYCFECCCKRKDMAPVFGIGIAMLSAVLCCLVAARMESIRLKDIKNRNQPTIFWLVPQYLFLAILNAFFEVSVKDFFEDQAPLYKDQDPQDQQDQTTRALQEQSPQSSLRKYTMIITHFVIGLGFMASAISILATAQISKRLGKDDSWFKKDIEHSHLDKYYLTLAILSSIGFIWYVVAIVSYSCIKRKSSRREQDVRPLTDQS